MKKAEMNFEITKYSDITEMTIFADGKDIGGYIAEPDKTYLSIRTFNDKGSANGHKFYKSKSGMNKALANFGLTLDEVKATFEKLTGESAAKLNPFEKALSSFGTGKGKFFLTVANPEYVAKRNFANLTDAIKAAREVYSDLKAAGHKHLTAKVKAFWVDISKLADRADVTVLFYGINMYGDEELYRREADYAIAELDNITLKEVEEILYEICEYDGNEGQTCMIYRKKAKAADEIIADCVDEYFVDTDAAAEVEIKNAEIAKAVSAKLDEIYAWDKFTMTIDDAVNAATDEITLTNQRGHVETFRKVKHGITSDIFFHVERTVNGKGFEVGCCFATMAVYEKPEQVADVLLKLAEDVKSGKTEFVFPTQEEYDAKLAAFENRRRDICNLRDTQKMIRKCISAGDIDSAESLFSYAGALLREIRQAA